MRRKGEEGEAPYDEYATEEGFRYVGMFTDRRETLDRVQRIRPLKRGSTL